MFSALFGLLATAGEGSRLDVSVLFIMVVMTTVRLAHVLQEMGVFFGGGAGRRRGNI